MKKSRQDEERVHQMAVVYEAPRVTYLGTFHELTKMASKAGAITDHGVNKS